jgi:hypothetical protein
MKKQIVLSTLTVALLSTANLQAADSLEAMFSEGKVSGQIREFSIIRSIETSNGGGSTRKANAIGGHLKYETAPLSGVSVGAAFYTTNGFLNQTPKTNYNAVDPTLLGDNNDAYSILGEAYVQAKFGNTTLKAGRQKLDTPLAGSDDARMLPNLFEAYTLTNTDIANTTLVAAHVTKFAQGTFGRAYAGGILAATSGYSAVTTPSAYSRTRVGEFVNMGEYSVGKNTSGVTVGAAIYKDGNFKAQLWDYYAHDILNAIYGEVNYSWKCMINENVKPFVGAQMIKESDIGDKQLKNIAGTGTIDSTYYALKAGFKIENFTATVAYSSVGANSATDNIYQNAIITPWGGMPAYTQGMVTRHQFLAGTDATKLAISYNWKAFGPDLSTAFYYTDFDMAANNAYTFGDAKESGFDFIYKPAAVKNLNLRLRGNFADDFNVNGTGVTTSWNEYRFIVNYNF